MNTNQLGVGAPITATHDPIIANVPLPSSEEDFAFGCISSPPAYYPGSALATLSPAPISLAGAMIVCAHFPSMFRRWLLYSHQFGRYWNLGSDRAISLRPESSARPALEVVRAVEERQPLRANAS